MGKTVNWIDWIAIALYALVMAGIAVYHSRKLKHQEDIFLAGRSMSRWPIALSMYMALFSTNTFLGVTGWVNRPDGTVWIGLQTIGIILAVPLVCSLYPTLFFRLRITTAYEYMERRFNYRVRALATLFFLGSRVMWMATMLYSSALVVSTMLGWTPARGVPAGQVWSIFLIGGMGTAFALIGGMHAVIWTDTVQFFILLAGLIVMITSGLASSGGFGQAIATGIEHGKFAPPSLFSLTDELSVISGLLLGFVGMLSSSGADQVVLQTYLTAKSDREAKASLWRNGIFLKPMSLVYPLLGLVLFAFYRAHPDVASLMRIPDDALPVFVVNVLPPGIRGLMIIAIVAAVMTSIESGMAAVSAAIQVDYAGKLIRRPLSGAESVRLARGLLLVCGGFTIAVACWVRTLGEKNNIVQILNIVMYPFTGVLLGIFLLGILTRRANGPGVLAGALVGFLATVAVPLSKVAVSSMVKAGAAIPPGLLAALGSFGQISGFYFGFLGAALTLLVGYAASLCFPPPGEERLRGLTRRSMPAPLEEAATR